MRIVFFSDIHGVPSTLEQLLKRADDLQADQLVLLGDVLYHGPHRVIFDKTASHGCKIEVNGK